MTDDLNRDWSAGDGNYYEHVDLYKRVQLLIIEDLMTTPIETRNAVASSRSRRRAGDGRPCSSPPGPSPTSGASGSRES